MIRGIVTASLLAIMPSSGPLAPCQAADDFDVKFSSKMAFEVVNDTRERRGIPHVRDVGKLPLRLNLSDTGRTVGRRLRLAVVVYERVDSKSMKPGKLVTQYLDPGIMVSQEPGTNIIPFSADLPLKKGDYIFYVVLCDPDQPVIRPSPLEKTVDLDKLPGLPLHMKACGAHVD